MENFDKGFRTYTQILNEYGLDFGRNHVLAALDAVLTSNEDQRPHALMQYFSGVKQAATETGDNETGKYCDSLIKKLGEKQ